MFPVYKKDQKVTLDKVCNKNAFIYKWKKAVFEEMKALEKNNTWEKVNLLEGKTSMGCKWVFMVKFNSNGSLERHKVRSVANGFTQTSMIDYQETFAPVAKLNIIQVLLSIVVNLEWSLH